MAELEQDSALHEAASWFARRQRGVMSLEERAEFERWHASRRNAAAMDEMEHAWARIDQARDRFTPAVSPTPVGRFAFARSAVLALLCVLSLGVGLVSYSGHSSFWTRLDWVER
jgi:ferric-dicitrate binding protein FerR (iron transport regulator)